MRRVHIVTPCDIPNSTSTPKEEKQKINKDQNKKDIISCKECSYTCKKEESLKKHMITKHDEHQCKECKCISPTFMDFLKHITKHQYKDQENV